MMNRLRIGAAALTLALSELLGCVEAPKVHETIESRIKEAAESDAKPAGTPTPKAEKAEAPKADEKTAFDGDGEATSLTQPVKLTPFSVYANGTGFLGDKFDGYFASQKALARAKTLRIGVGLQEAMTEQEFDSGRKTKVRVEPRLLFQLGNYFGLGKQRALYAELLGGTEWKIYEGPAELNTLAGLFGGRLGYIGRGSGTKVLLTGVHGTGRYDGDFDGFPEEVSGDLDRTLLTASGKQLVWEFDKAKKDWTLVEKPGLYLTGGASYDRQSFEDLVKFKALGGEFGAETLGTVPIARIPASLRLVGTVREEKTNAEHGRDKKELYWGGRADLDLRVLQTDGLQLSVGATGGYDDELGAYGALGVKLGYHIGGSK